MQIIEQFVKERQEIKPLQTCESYFLTFRKQMCSVSFITFALQKTVEMRFYPDTNDLFHALTPMSVRTNYQSSTLYHTHTLISRTYTSELFRVPTLYNDKNLA